MSRIFVAGRGAVSPAGWGVPALWEAVARGTSVPPQPLERPGLNRALAVRAVPMPSVRPTVLSQPRLRRATLVTQYAAAAASEALAGWDGARRGDRRLGVIGCLQSGCVQYSCRFFDEVLKDPATASPLLFPETVFAAATSHVAVLFAPVERATTLVGDPGVVLEGLALAVDWLAEDAVDIALVLSADETNWMHSEAAWYLDHGVVLAMGAGALALTREPSGPLDVELEAITSPVRYGARIGRVEAAQAMRAQLPHGGAAELLCEGTQGLHRTDAAERGAWADWPGRRMRPKLVLGEGLGAGVAWQCILATEALARGGPPAAIVSVVGCNHEAIAARFGRVQAVGS